MTRPPSPKVKAAGGLPEKISAEFGLTTSALKVSAIARTSLCECIVAFGFPVVPEVNASMQVSLASES